MVTPGYGEDSTWSLADLEHLRNGKARAREGHRGPVGLEPGSLGAEADYHLLAASDVAEGGGPEPAAQALDPFDRAVPRLEEGSCFPGADWRGLHPTILLRARRPETVDPCLTTTP